MSEEKLAQIRRRLEKIEQIYQKAPHKEEESDGRNRYGGYQHFQSVCMAKVDPTNPNSPSKIEVITGQDGMHSTERMARCGDLWRKYRGRRDPISGLEEELQFGEKVRKGEVKPPSE
jgi:hypothetical protein